MRWWGPDPSSARFDSLGCRVTRSLPSRRLLRCRGSATLLARPTLLQSPGRLVLRRRNNPPTGRARRRRDRGVRLVVGSRVPCPSDPLLPRRPREPACVCRRLSAPAASSRGRPVGSSGNARGAFRTAGRPIDGRRSRERARVVRCGEGGASGRPVGRRKAGVSRAFIESCRARGSDVGERSSTRWGWCSRGLAREGREERGRADGGIGERKGGRPWEPVWFGGVGGVKRTRKSGDPFQGAGFPHPSPSGR